MNKPKVLISITRKYILEAYFEYLIRYLGNEFIIDQAYTPYPPYDKFAKNPTYNGNNPMMRNPDEYDLILPHFPTHWNVWGDEHWTDKSKDYARKIALILWDGMYGRQKDVAVVGATNPIITKQLRRQGIRSYPLQLGLDFDLFKPIKLARDTSELRVGIIGHYLQPRRMMREIFPKIRHIPGVKFMVFPTDWEQAKDNHDSEAIFEGDYSCIYPGNRWFNGLPNVYNSVDVLLRMDEGIDYALPVMEAAACGIPSICTSGGNVEGLAKSQGCFLIPSDVYDADGFHNNWYYKNIDTTVERIRMTIEFVRDNPGERIKRGVAALMYARMNWGWDNAINKWRAFLNEGISNARRLN